MPAGIFTLFSANKDDIKLLDLPPATVLKMILTTSLYVPDTAVAGHSLLADVTNEMATGGGYTAGGLTLTTVARTAITGGWKITSDNPVWTASGAGIPAWRNAVMHVSGNLWGKVNPLVGVFVADTTAGGTDAPATAAPNPLTITMPASGWFQKV